MYTYYVYILICSDNSYYVGVTNNMERRITQHQLGLIKGYTKRRRPLKLVFSQEYKYIHDAINAEKRLKGWRREKKEALINGNEELLIQLSKSYSNSRPSTGSG